MCAILRKTLTFLAFMGLIFSYAEMGFAKVGFCAPGKHSCTFGSVFGAKGKKGCCKNK